MKNAVRFPHLQTAPLLRDLSDEFRVDFLEGCAIRTFEQGETILAQGEAVKGMYIIAHGSVEVTSFNPEGQSVLIHLYRQADIFGEPETLAERHAAANCVAANQAVLLFCAKDLLLESTKNHVFLRNLMSAGYDRLVRDNSTKFVDQFYPVEQRLCDYLYRLSADKPVITKTQADLAGLLGCARQTLNRELGRLRGKKILTMEKGKIHILDRQALLVQATTAHTSD